MLRLRVRFAATQRVSFPALFIALTSLGVASLVHEAARAQSGVPPQSPAATLPPPPVVTQTTSPQYDPFAPIINGDVRFSIWHTRQIKFGSWGSELQWDPQTICDSTLQEYRNTFVQKIFVAGGWIPQSDSSELGESYFQNSVTMIAPLGSVDNVVLLTPTAQVQWLSGPNNIDVPARLYSFFADIGWRYKFNNDWALVAGLRPGIFSDLESRQNAFRLSGLAGISCDLIPKRLSVLAGVVYLDRNDFNWIPAFGLNWKPTPDYKIDVVFPRPKIAYRVGHVPYFSEDWIYLRGNIGGGTFAVERANGSLDELTLRDYRIAFGIERVVSGGTGANIELGWVFARKMEYINPVFSQNFSDALILEAGFSF